MGALDGRVAIITGGGRGIGAAIAERFTREGASVVLNDLGTSPDGVGGDSGPAEQMAQKIRSTGGKAIADGGDISDTATGERLVSMAVSEFGKLDIVVNVAGILRDKMLFNLEPADWDAVIRVHLRGHYSTLRPASAYWREQKNPDGNYRVINFTSIAGLQGSPGQANYSAAKLGIVGLTYSVAQGLARYGVTANAISPVAGTRLTAGVGAPGPAADGTELPAEDPMSPHNIAPLATFLASKESHWLSGRVLTANGTQVALWSNPEEIVSVDNEAPWRFDQIVAALEENIRPVADGLPYSVFVPAKS